jgi:hypothetical protein
LDAQIPFQVWASKWNERAYFSTRKVKLDHDYLSMAVLVQEIVNADYAFVIHTTNPSSGDSSEIYAEVVKGLGETLVGAYPGRAMSFVCNKANLDSPKVKASLESQYILYYVRCSSTLWIQTRKIPKTLMTQSFYFCYPSPFSFSSVTHQYFVIFYTENTLMLKSEVVKLRCRCRLCFWENYICSFGAPARPNFTRVFYT